MRTARSTWPRKAREKEENYAHSSAENHASGERCRQSSLAYRRGRSAALLQSRPAGRPLQCLRGERGGFGGPVVPRLLLPVRRDERRRRGLALSDTLIKRTGYCPDEFDHAKALGTAISADAVIAGEATVLPGRSVPGMVRRAGRLPSRHGRHGAAGPGQGCVCHCGRECSAGRLFRQSGP